MNILQGQARHDFLQSQEFEEPDLSIIHSRSVTLIEVLGHPSASQTITHSLEHVPESELVARIIKPATRSTESIGACYAPTAKLHLVRIDRSPYGRLHIARDSFLNLIDALELEPYTLYMLQRESYGFHRFARNTHSPPDNAIETFYIKTISSLLVWSHNSSTRWTKGIIIPRISDSVHDMDGIFDSFTRTLVNHHRLVHHPWLLRYVAAVETSRWIDRILEHELGLLRQAETKTGHGCWGSWEQRPPKPIDCDEFADISKLVGFSAAALANVVRHIRIATTLMDINLPSECVTPVNHGVGDRHEIIDDPIHEISLALGLLREELDARKLDTEYLQERARVQLQVVFNLINQNDATVNREIAKSTKEDGTSMRVIALMTMFFLPGTFFATLFSVPSLQWDERTVITSRFWVYLAFTLPCTLIVIVMYKFYGRIMRMATRLDEKLRQKVQAHKMKTPGGDPGLVLDYYKAMTENISSRSTSR